MRKLLLPMLLALTVSGCALFKDIANPITQSRLDTINASWGAALAIAANYRDACAQRLIPASCRTVVPKLQNSAIVAQAAVNRANQASLSPTTNAAQLLELASDAINDFKVLQMTYGVK